MAEPDSKKKAQAKAQYDRFAQTARALGCDEDHAHFDEALKKVARHKPAKGGVKAEKPPRVGITCINGPVMEFLVVEIEIEQTR
jgi:hypothetical protein